MTISLDSIISVLNKIADILLVWLMFYYILKNIKNNVKLTLIFKGVIVFTTQTTKKYFFYFFGILIFLIFLFFDFLVNIIVAHF